MREPITLSLTLAIALGGAFGAVLRFMVTNAVSRHMPHTVFPLDTLVVNMLGAVFMAVILEFAALRWSVSLEMRAFLLFGVIGGFTTFSRFTMDVLVMLERGDWVKAATYIFISVFATTLAGYGAMKFTRILLEK